MESIERRIDEELSKEVISIANKIDDHMTNLDNIIKDGNADTQIETKHKWLESEVTALLEKVTDEHILTDEARIAVHQLQERILQAKDSVEDVEEKNFENSSMAGKAALIAEKRKLPAALTVGIAKWIREIRENVKEKKWFRNKTWWRVKWIFSWLLRWGITYAWAHIVGYVSNLIDWMDPRNRAKNAKTKVANWRDKLFHKTGERYDPKNQDVQDARHDSDPEKEWLEWPELWMDDLNRPIFWWKDWRTELAVLPNDIVIAEVYKKDQIDILYNDPQFTDQFLLFVTTTNMWVQAARKKDQSGGIFSTKDSGIGSIQLREQDILEIQKMVRDNKDKKTILDAMKNTMNDIQRFEHEEKGVIWNDWRKNVIPTINSYSIGSDREKSFEQAQLKIYDAFRKVWGITHGDSTVVQMQLYDDLGKTEKYKGVDTLFEGEQWEEIFEHLAKIWPKTTSDEQLSKIITTHLRTHGLFEDVSKKQKGLKEAVVAKITKSIITTYHEAQKNITNNAGEFKKYFTRAYGLEIDTDTKQQQKMISAYEQMYGVENLSIYAKEKWKEYTDENKRSIVRDFARDMVKKNALCGAVMSAYKDVFFDAYLPTQRTLKSSQRNKEGDYTENYIYSDEKEKLLAKIIGAGGYISDNTINSSINIGINIAVSLIPIVWVEFAVARLAGGMLAKGILTAGTMSSRVAMISMKAVLGHIAMTSFNGITNEKSAGDILENLTDRREFAQNAIFFNVIGQVWPRIRNNIGKIPKMGKVDPSKLAWLNEYWLGRLTMMTAMWWVETGVLQGTRALLDPNYEWNRGEVITVFMLSTILAGKVGQKAKDYTATKMPDGKIKLVPKKTVNIVKKIETWNSTMNAKTLWHRYEQRLTKAADGESVLMGQTVVKTTKNGTTTYAIKGQSSSFTSPKEIITQIKKNTYGAKITSEQVHALRADDLSREIERMVTSGKTFTRWKDTFKLQVDQSWTVQIMKKWPKWFTQIAEQELNILLTTNQPLIANTSKKFFEQAAWSKKQMADLRKTGKISKQEFTDWCRTHNISRTENMLVGDFFRLVGEWKIRQLLFGKLTNFKWLTPNQSMIPTKTARRLIWTGKNAWTLFNISSIAYGWLIGDNGDAGWDEAAENYLLYSVLGRGIIGKIALAIFDASDIAI
jgi:hypothetical protein